jgi:hypothetical protein
MLKNKTYMKIIAGTTLGLLIIASCLSFKIQEGKIEALKEELYLKKQNEQRATDFYQSTLNIKTLQTEFNTLKEYSIQKNCKINMDHKYNYSNDGVLGIQHEIELDGRGQVQYDINVRFDTAIITPVDNKTIKIKIDKPYIDENSVKLVENSLVMKSSDCNFWANKHDGLQAQKFYMDSFVESGRNNVIDLYKTRNKQNYINQVAIAEVQALIRTFNLNNCNVIIEILE